MDDKISHITGSSLYRHIRSWAKRRMVSPAAVLAATLARIAAATQPGQTIPPVVGSPASLNLGVVLVGPSGSGKDVAVDVSREAVIIPGEPPTRPLVGSDALSRIFTGPTGSSINSRALVTIGEIDTISSATRRRGGPFAAQIRQALTGEPLGAQLSATPSHTPGGSYRCAIIIGAQPERAGILLGRGGIVAGTPQRMLWSPATDHDPDPDAPEPPPPLQLDLPRHQLEIDARIARQVRAERTETLAGTGVPLDSHRGLMTLKIAALLALADGRTLIGVEDHAQAVSLVGSSDLVVRGLLGMLDEVGQAERVQADVHAAQTCLRVSDHIASERLGRAMAAVRRHMVACPDRPLSRQVIEQRLMPEDLEYLDLALLRLTDDGVIERIGQVDPSWRLRR